MGFPLDDNKVLLLNEDGQEVGFNQVGEITVKSRYLALGYWGKPELTREAFHPDPAGADQRIYRMGDLGRRLPNGCLELLGRKDSQVKIRGYRVEVAEIEMQLLELDTVKRVAVVAQIDVSGNQRLVAYIVPGDQPAPTTSELRRILAEKLPVYMIPSAFVMLDTLPQLPNGKLDRRALPALGTARPELESPLLLPRTPVEQALAEIWAEVLGLEQVGIHDNFLELGGDSLLASQVISRVIQAFQVEVPLRSLFDSPTVAKMALIIVQNQAKRAEQEHIDRMLAELEGLSDEQAQRLLTDENESTRESDV